MDKFTETLYRDNNISFYGSLNGHTGMIAANIEAADLSILEVFVNGEKWGPPAFAG